MGEVLRIGDLLDGHAALDMECLDQIYLNGYVPKLAGRWAGRLDHDRAPEAGVAVVNIDNGYGARHLAAQIAAR